MIKRSISDPSFYIYVYGLLILSFYCPKVLENAERAHILEGSVKVERKRREDQKGLGD